MLLTGVNISRLFQLDFVDYRVQNLRGGYATEFETTQRRLSRTIWGGYEDIEPISMNIDTPEIEMREQEDAPASPCTADQSFILLKNRALGVYVHVNASDGRMYPYSGPVGSIAPRAFRIVPTPEEGSKGVMLKSVASGKYVRPLGRGEEGYGYVADGRGGIYMTWIYVNKFHIVHHMYLYV